MKNKIGMIYCFSICIIFILFGSLMELDHKYATGASTAIGAGVLHGIVGVFLLARKKKPST